MEIYLKILLTMFAGIVVFIFRDNYLKNHQKKELKDRLKAKLIHWQLGFIGESLYKLFIVGHALSEKFDFYSNMNNIEKYKEEIDKEIDERLEKVGEEFKQSEVAKEIINEVPKMHEKVFELWFNEIEKLEANLKDGTTLLDKSEISKLNNRIQLKYHVFNSDLATLIFVIKRDFTILRYNKTIEVENINDKLMDVFRLSIQTTMSMYLLMNEL